MFFALVGALVIAVVLCASAVSLFWRSGRGSPNPESGWTATDEVFNDPVTDRTMRVWEDQTGQRHYLPEISDGAGPIR
jgi:hypothetical protein